jgi:hypothetical protein
MAVITMITVVMMLVLLDDGEGCVGRAQVASVFETDLDTDCVGARSEVAEVEQAGRAVTPGAVEVVESVVCGVCAAAIVSMTPRRWPARR